MISSLMFIWLRSTLPQFASYLSSFQTDPSDWTANQGLLLQTRSDATPGQYTGEVTWTLQNTVE